MKITRKDFIKTTAILGAGAAVTKALPITRAAKNKFSNPDFPKVISTWNHGLPANEAAMKILLSGGSPLDAIEKGIITAENNPDISSVGYGGLPDSDGNVTLDACVMDWNGNAGGVAFLKEIKNPIAVAKLVMQKTPHVLLVGEGARQFAIQNGFKPENLLTDSSRKWWEEKIKSRDAKTKQHKTNEDHDTIGQIAIGADGKISGGVSTSGLGFKVPGRVGDSPIIGAGLYVDNEIGGACATGLGELAMKSLGSFLIVEKMRDGMSPEDACKFIVERIYKKYPMNEDTQIAFVAINKSGDVGAFAMRDGFTYCVATKNKNEETNSGFLIK